MSTIRLEHEKFAAAPLLAVLLSDRMLTVSDASGDAAGDVKSTTFVCSAAYEASIGGESAAMAIGRNVRAGRMMIIDEGAPLFSVTEALGGKLIRLAIPSASTADPACNYGLQLAATMLSDDRTVACGDQASRDLLAWLPVAKPTSRFSSMGLRVPEKRFSPNSFTTIPNAPMHPLSR